jgi:hypothetical protein
MLYKTQHLHPDFKFIPLTHYIIHPFLIPSIASQNLPKMSSYDFHIAVSKFLNQSVVEGDGEMSNIDVASGKLFPVSENLSLMYCILLLVACSFSAENTFSIHFL